MQNLATIKAGYREAKRIIKHGPGYPWRRYITSTEVLKGFSLHTDQSADITVCALTSRGDWLACLWSLVSLYKFGGLRLPLLIYSDGSLDGTHRARIRSVFPDVRIVDPAEADSTVSRELSGLPNCKRFRLAQPCARRIIDFPMLSTTSSILMLDSDVLFFRPPNELVMHLDARHSGQFVFERDIQDAYFESRRSITRRFDVQVAGHVNCGIMLADISNFDYARIERWLGRASFEKHPWAEQTLWAMYAGEGRTTLLGREYDVTMSHRVESSAVMKHYIKPIREFMYTQGIPYLIRCLERGAGWDG